MMMRRVLFLAAAVLTMAGTASAQQAGRLAPAAQRTFLVNPHSVSTVQRAPGAVAQSRTRELNSYVRGDTGSLPAAFQELVLKNVRNAETMKRGEYGDSPHVDSPQVLKVSGVPNGELELTHIGTMSTHDFAGINNAGVFEQRLQSRASGDRVRISFDYGEGTPSKVLVDRGQGGVVSQHDVKVPLNPNGTTRLIYERQDSSGNVVGSRWGYQMGRIVNIQWDGSK